MFYQDNNSILLKRYNHKMKNKKEGFSSDDFHFCFVLVLWSGPWQKVLNLEMLSPFKRKLEASWSVNVSAVVAVTGLFAVHTNTIIIMFLSHSCDGDSCFFFFLFLLHFLILFLIVPAIGLFYVARHVSHFAHSKPYLCS